MLDHTESRSESCERLTSETDTYACHSHKFSKLLEEVPRLDNQNFEELKTTSLSKSYPDNTSKGPIARLDTPLRRLDEDLMDLNQGLIDL